MYCDEANSPWDDTRGRGYLTHAIHPISKYYFSKVEKPKRDKSGLDWENIATDCGNCDQWPLEIEAIFKDTSPVT